MIYRSKSEVKAELEALRRLLDDIRSGRRVMATPTDVVYIREEEVEARVRALEQVLKRMEDYDYAICDSRRCYVVQALLIK